MAYILVNTHVLDAVELCKQIEGLEVHTTAIVVQKSKPLEGYHDWQSYVGEFYSTPQAIERINK